MKSRLLVLSGDHPIELKIAYFSTFFQKFALFCTILVLLLKKKPNWSTNFAKMCMELHTCVLIIDFGKSIFSLISVKEPTVDVNKP